MDGRRAAGSSHAMGWMRAVSPVVSTVILTLVAVVVAVGIAFWLAGFASLTGSAVERLEFGAVQVAPRAAGDGWDVTLQLGNLGTVAVTVDSILINGVHYYDCKGVFLSPQPSITLNPGERVVLTLHLLKGAGCGGSTLSSGVAVEVKLHTSSGREYSCIFNLP